MTMTLRIDITDLAVSLAVVDWLSSGQRSPGHADRSLHGRHLRGRLSGEAAHNLGRSRTGAGGDPGLVVVDIDQGYGCRHLDHGGHGLRLPIAHYGRGLRREGRPFHGSEDYIPRQPSQHRGVCARHGVRGSRLGAGASELRTARRFGSTADRATVDDRTAHGLGHGERRRDIELLRRQRHPSLD